MTHRASREIIIDISRLVGRFLEGRHPTGVDRVSLDYVRHFADRAQALVRYRSRWVELTPALSERAFDALLTPEVDFRRRIRRAIGMAMLRPLRPAATPRFLFNTGHSGLERADYRTRLERVRTRPIFFVHDLIPITHPEYCRPGEKERHERRIAAILGMAHGVIANSRATATRLEDYAAHLGLAMPSTVVAPLPTTPLPAPAEEPSLQHPYFIVLGTIEPRKNHMLLLHVWRRLVEDLGERAPRLVVVGQRGWECENVADMLERCEPLRGFVLEQPRCTDAELATWLRHSQGLLFPSHEEGYGLPLIEALAHGVPAIASDLPVFHEIAGDVPEYMDDLDGLGWLRVIKDYTAPNSARRAAQMERIRHFSPPTHAAHFAVVEGLLDSLRKG